MRRVQERRNSDMYSARVHGPPWRGDRQDARAHRVGGGQRDSGAYRLQRVVALPVMLLVVLSTAMDHGTEALEEVTMHHAFLVVVVVSIAVDRTGDTLLILLTLL